MASFARFACASLILSCAVPLVAADATPAAAPADTGVSSLKQELADTKDQLATSLRSYSLLEDQIRQLKEDADKNAAQMAADAQTIAALKAQVPLAAQAGTLGTQVRELQNQCASLAQEVYDLKTRLALASPPPAAARPAH